MFSAEEPLTVGLWGYLAVIESGVAIGHAVIVIVHALKQ